MEFIPQTTANDDLSGVLSPEDRFNYVIIESKIDIWFPGREK
jgi:hypothetical protein